MKLAWRSRRAAIRRVLTGQRTVRQRVRHLWKRAAAQVYEEGLEYLRERDRATGERERLGEQRRLEE